MRILAFDTEDDSKGNPLLVNFYDGQRHFTFTNMLEAWEWITAQSPCHVWACNTEYDLLNLFGDWTARVLTLQYVSSGLMRATMLEADVTFFDTMRHANPPLSVSAMGKLVGKEKLRDYISDRVTDRLVKACQVDTEIVYDYVKLRLDQYNGLGLNIASTLPSMAMQYWNKYFNHWDLPRLKKETREKFRQGYYGGRVEVFRFHEINGPVYHYDVNSLYPYVMKKFQYPDITKREKHTKDPDFDLYGMASIDIVLPFHEIPCLPYRSDKEILFPYGQMSGVYCYPEIRKALDDGGKILRVNWAIEYPRGIDPFSKYVETCYRNRLESKTQIDSNFWKMMMNSLYGKFGSKDKLLTISADQEFSITTPSRFSNVIWSAYVTTYARLILLDYLRKSGEVYYTDTDSIFTSNEMKTSKDLGALKLEGIYKCCEFFGNKVYVVDDKYKARGIPKKKPDAEYDPAKEFIREGRCIFRRPARLRESRKSSARANVWYDAEKSFNAKYTKRKILKHGATIPLTLDSYKI